jgi:hypothetical protein
MKFPQQHIPHTTRWHAYQTLELIPDAAPEPKAHPFVLTSPVSWMWQFLINALVQEHVCEARTDYFERCWSMNYEDPYTSTPQIQLQQLWELMN